MKSVDEKRAAGAMKKQRGKSEPRASKTGKNEQGSSRAERREVPDGLKETFEIALSIQFSKNFLWKPRAVPPDRRSKRTLRFAQQPHV